MVKSVLAEDLLRVIQAALVNVGDGHQLDARHFRRRVHISGSHAAEADGGDLHAVVGRHFGFLARERRRVESRGGGALQEMSSGGRHSCFPFHIL